MKETLRHIPGRIQIARLLLAIILGCAVAILPNVTANLPESGFAGLLKGGIQWLLMPGVVLTMILYRNVHNYSLWVLEGTNVVFYSGLAYYLMKRKAAIKGKSTSRTGVDK